MHRDSISRPKLFLTLLVSTLFIAAACTSGGNAGSEAAAPADSPAPPPPVDVAADAPTPVAPGTGLTNGLAEFDFSVAVANSYWYSRFTLGNLAMMSGLGVPFMPPMEAVMGMVQAVDQGPEAGEHVMLPANPALLQAVYASGHPQFVNAFNGDPGDLTNYRWDPTSLDTTITPSAQAQTIIKEIEWAKFFNNPGWAGGVDSDFGAMDRFKGMVMFASAAMQTNFALTNLRNADGFFVAASTFNDGTVTVTDDAVQAADQYQMLQALSDVRWLLQHADDFNGVYANPDLLKMVSSVSDELFVKVQDLTPAGVQDLGLAAQAATWYAATTDDPTRQQEALGWLGAIGDQLREAQPDGVIEHARAARGLFEAGRLLSDTTYEDAALTHVNALLDAYHVDTGHFDGLTTIVDWEVGDILGALNSALVNGDASLDRMRVQQTYAGFFEAVVNIGGLLQAVIPKEMEASPFELVRFQNDLAFGYPGIPFPMEAGGANGTAAVHASVMTFDAEAGRWQVTDGRFDTAGAMHTSNEMFWTFGFVDGFPDVDVVAVANVLPTD